MPGLRTKMVLPFIILLICFAFNVQYIYSFQVNYNSISGIIKDSKSGEVIYNANIYLSNTTIGTSSDMQGKYLISNIPDGVYDLVIRVIGYEIKVVSLKLSGGQHKRKDIALVPKVIDLNEVIISSPQPDEWKKWLKIFEKEFIGETENSSECKIQNPEVINFYWDNDRSVFTASTDSIIIIENKSLGYKLHIVLLSFEVSTDPYRIRYKILPRFEELVPADQQKMENIQLNRINTYRGSFRHFLTRVKQGRIGKDLYRLTYGNIYDLEKKKGKYLPKDLLSVNVVIDDSSLISVTGPEYIGVEYFGNSGNDFSIIKLNTPAIFLDGYCNMLDPFAVTCYGYWAKQRIADLLPDNYQKY